MEVSNPFNVPAAAQAKKYFNLLKSKPEQKGGGKRKKGGTRHKNLGKKINELQISIDLLSKGNGRIARKISDIRQDINDAYANIQSNEQSIGTISSYINYKLDETHGPAASTPPLEKWTQHLNSIYNRRDRNAHDVQILRNAEMLGGRRKKTRKRRRKKTKRKRRRNKKTRRKKSRR